ncbi:MAG: hypothetical protein JRJ84_24895, partial [Deltaproteobacteria bacterium]|nr:hypothetical protein [Deltaproteobacteria bacterium]
LVIGAYLATRTTSTSIERPPVAPPLAQAVVFHPNARIRQTVVSALRDMGVLAEGLDPRLQLHRPLQSDTRVFADPDTLTGLAHLAQPPHAVLLIERSQTPPTDGYVIRVPFTIGELQQIVEVVMRRDSIDTA